MVFSILHQDINSGARIGTLTLPHGSLTTPVFMPVGTQAAVKGLDLRDLDTMGFRLMLSNTYHLYLRPGDSLIKKAGGLHRFMNWPHNVLTDSGGFQVFSLPGLRKITPEGVKFRSHIDGSLHLLTPEKVVDLQVAFGSDIQMVLDVCTPPEITQKKALGAVLTTTAWAARAKKQWLLHRDNGYSGAIFAIVQGNFFEDLRRQSVAELVELDFPGYAIGGLSVGESFETFTHFLSMTSPQLPSEKPRYLMGIGTPEYILTAVENGIDMFDCVFPTRVARNGYFFTRHGRLVIKNERYKEDLRPIEESGPIQEYSRAYLRHLFKSEEMLGPMLATRHNLFFLKRLMSDIHESIREGCFLDFKRQFLVDYNRGIPE